VWKRILPITAALVMIAAGPALAAGPTITVTAKDAPLAAKYSAEGSLLGWARAGRVSVTSATGDVTGDGVADLVTSADGLVTVYDRGVAVRRFSPYGDRAIIAISVADIDGDGRADIATGHVGGGPFVKVYSGADLHLMKAFYAGGSDKAIIAIALSRAIIAIVVGPEVKVYDTVTLATRAVFLPFGGAQPAGVAIA
jgi:VCBS repeat protein